MHNMFLVALENVSKSFCRRGFFSRAMREHTRALQNVSLQVSRGEVFGLLGPNGSGKSTLLRLVSTALLPDSGKVTVAGFDTRSAGHKVRERVGFALASERSFFPRLTARENLEFFAALENVAWRECRERAHAALSSVGLLDAAEKQVMKLSSGMHQRLAIARALLKNPQILLLDEPSRSLDAAACRQLCELVHQLPETGTAVFIATHNFAEAAEVCDRTAILQHGEIAETLVTTGLDERELRSCYLEFTGAPAKHEAIPA